MEKIIDWTKPVRHIETKCLARILCSDGPSAAYPVVVVVNGSLNTYTLDGRFSSTCSVSLENIPEPIPRTAEEFKAVVSRQNLTLDDLKIQADRRSQQAAQDIKVAAVAAQRFARDAARLRAAVPRGDQCKAASALFDHAGRRP